MKQKNISLSELSSYLNNYLEISKFDENAYNGVQVANTAPITHVATAVTASLQAIEKAAQLKAQALIVHHGIFTKNSWHPLTDIQYKKIKMLIDHDIALLGYHLPLDAHQEIGNNWKAARDLGLQDLAPFGEYNKMIIGVKGSMAPTSFEAFKQKAEKYYGNSAAVVKVKDPIASVAIISGGADKFVKAAAQAEADCFITGRFDEPVWDDAHENNISFLGLGHYATETIGVKALADHLQKKFDIPATFIKIENPF